MSHTREAVKRQANPVSLVLIAVMGWIILGGLLDDHRGTDRSETRTEESR